MYREKIDAEKSRNIAETIERIFYDKINVGISSLKYGNGKNYSTYPLAEKLFRYLDQEV